MREHKDPVARQSGGSGRGSQGWLVAPAPGGQTVACRRLIGGGMFGVGARMVFAHPPLAR
jgi:hypothetical protein